MAAEERRTRADRGERGRRGVAGGRGGDGARGGDRARLFVALELPGDVRDAVVRWRSSAVGEMGGLRLIAAEHLHVTLCFLGWRQGDEVERIAQACAQAAGIPPGVVSVGEAIWLPPRRPRVLAVKLGDDDDRLVQLQSGLSDLLEAGGWYTPERRAFMPHVTVARVVRHTSVSPVSLPRPPAVSFTASGVTLFRSHLSSAGARYDALARMELG